MKTTVPRLRANVGQRRAGSGRFRRPPDAPNRPLQAIRDAQERGKPHAMRAKTRLTVLLGSCKHILNLGRCHCTPPV